MQGLGKLAVSTVWSALLASTLVVACNGGDFAGGGTKTADAKANKASGGSDGADASGLTDANDGGGDASDSGSEGIGKDGKLYVPNGKSKPIPGGSKDKAATCEVQDEKVATCDAATGKVTGKKVGTTTITVTREDGKVDHYEVVVHDPSKIPPESDLSDGGSGTTGGTTAGKTNSGGTGKTGKTNSGGTGKTGKTNSGDADTGDTDGDELGTDGGELSAGNGITDGDGGVKSTVHDVTVQVMQLEEDDEFSVMLRAATKGITGQTKVTVREDGGQAQGTGAGLCRNNGVTCFDVTLHDVDHDAEPIQSITDNKRLRISGEGSNKVTIEYDPPGGFLTNCLIGTNCADDYKVVISCKTGSEVFIRTCPN